MRENKRYYPIILEDEGTQEKNNNLWYEILKKGKFIKNEYTFDFLVSTYEYNNKCYELWFNDNYGYNDHIEEYAMS